MLSIVTTQCALYARISVSDPNTPKVEIQLSQLRKLAAERGYAVADEYVDDGLSAAKAENRPAFDRMTTDLAAGKFKIILATEEARLARNITEKNGLMLTCVQVGAAWETIRDGQVDPTTAAGSFMAIIRGAVDTLESSRKSERQKSANLARRTSGRPVPGQRPFGWERDQLTPVPTEQAVLRQGIEMILSGEKPYAVTKAWNGSGVTTGRGNAWSSTSVVSVLRRWRNAGWTEHKGEPITEAQWQGVCTRDEHEQVLAILASRSDSVGWRSPAALCSGIARCMCGETMVKTGNSLGYAYRCVTIGRPGAKFGQHVSIKCAALDEQVRFAVVMSYLFDPHETDAADTEATALADLHRQRTVVRGQAEKLTDVFLDPETTLTRAEYQRRSQALSARAAELTDAIDARARQSAHAAMLSDVRELLFGAGETHVNATPALDDLKARFDALDVDARRRLVTGTLTSITVGPGRGIGRVEIRGRVWDKFLAQNAVHV